MSNCILFCSAGFDHPAEPIQPSDYIIAADGGLNHIRALGLEPDAILGDFDSLGYVPEGGRVFPVEKDDTDCILALRHGLRQGCRRFLIYGGMDGSRLDHTVANFQSLGFLAQHGAIGYLVGKDYIACAFQRGSLLFPAGAEGDFSLFCLGPDAGGVTIQGLHYPLDRAALTSFFPLGVSNHFTGAEARITVEEGCLLALWQRQAGIPIFISKEGDPHGL